MHCLGRHKLHGGAITLQGVTNKNIIRVEQPQQDKQVDINSTQFIVDLW
jgi:hypothetical protein